MELSKLVDHGTERLALRTIMRRLGNGDTTKNTLVNAINKPYIFNEEKDARVFLSYVIGHDYFPVNHENGTVYRTDIN